MAIPFKSSITLGQIFAQNNDFRILAGGTNKLSINNNSTSLSNASMTITGTSSVSIISNGSWTATSGYSGVLSLGSSGASFSYGQKYLNLSSTLVALNTNNTSLNIQAGTGDITLSGDTITLNDSTDVTLTQQGMNNNSVATVDYVWLNKIANPLLYTIDSQYHYVERLYFANNYIYRFKTNEDLANEAINTKDYHFDVHYGPYPSSGEMINSTAMDIIGNIMAVGYINGKYIIGGVNGVYRSTNYLFSSPTRIKDTWCYRIVSSPKIVITLFKQNEGIGYTKDGTTWNWYSPNSGSSSSSKSQALITPSYAYISSGNGVHRAALNSSSVNFSSYNTDANIGSCIWDGRYVVEVTSGNTTQLKYRREDLSLIKTITLDCRFSSVGNAKNYTFWTKNLGILVSDETIIYCCNGCYVVKTNVIAGETNSYDADNKFIYNPATDSVWYLGDAGGSSTIAIS